jgi:hypothetical protein
MNFSCENEIFDAAEMICLRTSDPYVPTIFITKNYRCVYAGDIRPLTGHAVEKVSGDDLRKLAERLQLPDLDRALAAQAIAPHKETPAMKEEPRFAIAVRHAGSCGNGYSSVATFLETQTRAYEIFVANGRHEGRADLDWAQAKHQLADASQGPTSWPTP